MYTNQYIKIKGRLTQKPEFLSTPTTEYCILPIACNSKIKDKEGNLIDHVNYYRVLGFGKRYRNIESLDIGQKIYAEGRIEIKTYTTAQDEIKIDLTIIANDIIPELSFYNET